jgi:hypothetical protein
LILDHAFGGEVFAEGAPIERMFRKFRAPILVVLGRIAVDGFIGASVDRKVGLTVAIEVGGSQHDTAGHGLFENAGLEGFAPPREKTREADVHG